MFYSPSKKKVRGWKRQIRKIEDWKQRVNTLDMKTLEEYHRDYVKIWIYPWYNLEKRNPPLWYSRLVLAEMIEIYLDWHKKMTKTGEDFYLKIWLYDPDFIHSQIVVAYKSCLHFYDKTFEVNPNTKPFPYHKFDSIRDQLKRFSWKLHLNQVTYTESDLTEGWYTKKEAERIRTKADQIKQIDMGNGEFETIYSIYTGDVWIGTFKE
ncbi:hypothetical protein ACFO25_12195 [Paenactinomyces guangxiensis]|uniref:Uncharacterized protein n=1 Tax=Paenactinomyces guangxiensis TaxID=1490290 RepID=A0A7W1WUF6_9BACL|nr:hypothetical protein [Paenactinomyces guangxiensis]MBA4496266.1 hypothetical protein [Paenactinomyces guangxiensis]MBH8593319.1 hypothetical protein [Paenactinomyces guangxiensis]